MRSYRLTVGALATAAVLTWSAGAGAIGTTPIDTGSTGPTTLAIIGDTPYGPAKLAEFPTLVSTINQDAQVQTVVHLGDIKNGSSMCSDAYFAQSGPSSTRSPTLRLHTG